MPLLLDADYAELEEQGLAYREDTGNRFLVLPGYPLPEGLYHQTNCDVLVIIPSNYNQAGIDMLWTFPYLTRLDGKAIPQTSRPGEGDNRSFEGREFCRWSRHWKEPRVAWRPGTDNVATILHRIRWAFGNPDAK
jgi:hypothetical protein